MLDALSKYLDLLKASGWQTGMIALAAGLFLYLSKSGVLPPLDPPWIELVVYAMTFLCGALAAASLGSAIQKVIGAVFDAWKLRRGRAKLRQAFINDIPFLTEKERQILGYLREKRQKRFNFRSVEDSGWIDAQRVGTTVGRCCALQARPLQASDVAEFASPVEAGSVPSGRFGAARWALAGNRTCSGYWNAELRNRPAA